MPEGEAKRELRGLSLRVACMVLLGLFLVAPCFWQSRIQAGDLASHAYNTWLASRIAEGLVPGLWIAPQRNNVLFDLMLVFLYSHLGMVAAQRIAVAAAVLVFASGAIRFISRGRDENLWFVIPCVAIFAYGFIFHLGFFNFYIAMGICLWYLTIFFSAGWVARILWIPLLALAWLAHPLPVVWAVGLSVYAGIAEHLPYARRITFLGIALGTILAARLLLAHHYQTFWSPGQVVFVTGATQSFLFDTKYAVPFALLLSIWIVLLRRFIKTRLWPNLISDVQVHLWLLTAAAIVFLPAAVTFPQYALPFSYITTRFSMAAGILLCGLLSHVSLQRSEKVVLLVTVTIYFAFVFHDTRRFNHMEDQVEAAIKTLPVGSRVIGSFPTTSTRMNPLGHILDRACIGHCFSYANYEPGSRQFRVRVGEENGVVLHDYADVAQVEMGKYRVQARDLPLFFVYSCGPAHDSVCLSELHTGDDIGTISREP